MNKEQQVQEMNNYIGVLTQQRNEAINREAEARTLLALSAQRIQQLEEESKAQLKEKSRLKNELAELEALR
jgi:hypothetical protein